MDYRCDLCNIELVAGEEARCGRCKRKLKKIYEEAKAEAEGRKAGNNATNRPS